jgi:transposase-like protein
MANREQFKLTTQERQRRSFSETFKRNKVQEIESKQVRVSDICRQYSVSAVSVYRWINTYGLEQHKHERLIIETMSDTKKIKELRERMAELERMVGQKQIEIEFYKKMIDLAQEHYGIEIKKTFLPHLTLLLAPKRTIPLQYEFPFQSA